MVSVPSVGTKASGLRPRGANNTLHGSPLGYPQPSGCSQSPSDVTATARWRSHYPSTAVGDIAPGVPLGALGAEETKRSLGGRPDDGGGGGGLL